MPVAGPNAPGTMATGGGGGAAWTTSADGGTSGAIGGGSGTQNLVASNFGFSIPAGVTILGIAVTLLRSATGSIKDFGPYLSVSPGGLGGVLHPDPNTWPSTPTSITYGGPTDTWGTTPALTPAIVNDPTFMVRFSESNMGGAGAVATISGIRMTVYYGSLTAAPSGIASAEAFGLLRVYGPTQKIILGGGGGIAYGARAYGGGGGGGPAGSGGIPSREAFGTPTVIPPRQTIAPAGIPSGQAFGLDHIVSIDHILPTGIPSREAFGTPLLTRRAFVNLVPAGIASAQAMGTPTVRPAAVTIRPVGIVSAELVGRASFIIPGTTGARSLPLMIIRRSGLRH